MTNPRPPSKLFTWPTKLAYVSYWVQLCNYHTCNEWEVLIGYPEVRITLGRKLNCFTRNLYRADPCVTHPRPSATLSLPQFVFIYRPFLIKDHHSLPSHSQPSSNQSSSTKLSPSTPILSHNQRSNCYRPCQGQSMDIRRQSAPMRRIKRGKTPF